MSRPAKGSAKLIPKPVRLNEAGHALVVKAAKLKGVTPAEFRRTAVLDAAIFEIRSNNGNGHAYTKAVL